MQQFSGFGPAIVIDNADPNNSGRVKVRLPQVSASGRHGLETWARVATLMAGNNRGSWFMPDVNDEVLVAFDGGDAGQCFVIGGLWSSTNPPPETMETNNRKKVLRSRNGVTITLDDQDKGEESFTVETPGGQRITLKDSPGSVEIADGNGNSVILAAVGIVVNSAAKVTLSASEVEVTSGKVTVNAGISNFSGVVQCDKLITKSVVSDSYTPGAGNIW